jgi:hypothetical protein
MNDEIDAKVLAVLPRGVKGLSSKEIAAAAGVPYAKALASLARLHVRELAHVIGQHPLRKWRHSGLESSSEVVAEDENPPCVPPEGPVVCYVCQSPATCFGRYEGHGPVQYGCDEHCGHGNEDGWCKPVEEGIDG